MEKEKDKKSDQKNNKTEEDNTKKKEASPEEKIKDLEEEKSLFVLQYQKLADQLHITRFEKSKILSKKIEFEMAQLNMAGSTFEIKISTPPNFLHINLKAF